MKTITKYLDPKEKNCLILSISLSLFIVGGLILSSQAGKTDLSYNELPERLVILEGNTLSPLSNPSQPEPKVVKKMSVIVTAYSSTVWETDDSPYVTAAGTWVRDGIVANNLLPFGTKVRIPEIYGDKIFVVEDRMNRKKGYYHVDIWLPSYWEAKNFGAKTTYVEVLES